VPSETEILQSIINEQQAPSLGENVARIIEIDAKIKDCDEMVDALKIERAAVEEVLKAQFSDYGVQNVKAMGKTVYLNRSIYCNVPGENMEQVVAVLDSAGLGDIAPRVATTAKIKGLLKEDEEVWKQRFGKLINTGEIFQIKTRSS